MQARKQDSCHCFCCRRFNGRNQAHASVFATVVCTAGSSRKTRPSLRADDIDNIRDSEEDDQSYDCYEDGMSGVAYSYDNEGPARHLDLSYAVTAAVEKFENKELETLIKNEYDIVEESETDEEFEIIDL